MDQQTNSAIDNRIYLILAVSLWTISISGINIFVFINPLKHTVTPVYHASVKNWIEMNSLYADGTMHYLPPFVFMFMPFHFLPAQLGDVLWRTVSSSLLAWGFWRMVGLLRPSQRSLFFLYATLIIFAPSFDSMRNGQANVIFAALTLHAAVNLALSMWTAASFCLVVAFMAKPIGIVMVLLAALIYRVIIWRTIAGLIIVLILPFLFSDQSYALSQYRQAFDHLYNVSAVTEHRFADINGLLRTMGVGLTGGIDKIVRTAAGFFTMVLWLIGARGKKEPQRALLLLGLTTTYLMLFNPMTEGNSYIIVAPALAMYAICFLTGEGPVKLGWVMVFMCISIGLFPEIFRSVDRTFVLWFSPAMMLIFGAVLIYISISRHSLGDRPAVSSMLSG